MLSYSFLKRLHPVDGHSVVRCTLFSPNGQLFAAGINYEVVVWRTDDWAIEFVQQSPSLVLSLAWERNDRLYFGSQSGLLTLIVISDEEFVTVCFQASHKPLEHISIQGNAGYMALGGADEVCVWKYNLPWTWAKTDYSKSLWKFYVKLDSPKHEADRARVQVTSLAWSSTDGPSLVVSYLNQGIIQWNIRGKAIQDVHRLSTPTPCGQLSFGGDSFAIRSNKGIRIYTVENGKNTNCLETEISIPRALPLIWIHGGTYILCALEGGAALWNVEKRCFLLLKVEDSAGVSSVITHLAYRKKELGHTSQRLIAMTSDSKSIGIWVAESPLHDAQSFFQTQALVASALVVICILLCSSFIL